MARHSALYNVQFGLAGCYMPDSTYGAFECATRRQLAELIREAVAFYDMPKRLARGHVRRLWPFIRRNGSSVAHFTIYHGANALVFSGMTREEYEAASVED